jgi:hypothetical protein
VGNLTLGGTGKTPTVELVARTLQELGAAPAVLSRGYGRTTRGVQVVADREAILDLRLRALTALERKRVEDEHADLQERIAELRTILGDESRIDGLIREELLEIKQVYGKGDDRRTEIVAAEGELELEDLIAEEDMVIAITRSGYIKRLPVTAYREQRRGGAIHAEAEERRMPERHHAGVADQDVGGHRQQPPDQDLGGEALPERRQHQRGRDEQPDHDGKADPVRPVPAVGGRGHLGVGTNRPVGRNSRVRISATNETITAWAGLTKSDA